MLLTFSCVKFVNLLIPVGKITLFYRTNITPIPNNIGLIDN